MERTDYDKEAVEIATSHRQNEITEVIFLLGLPVELAKHCREVLEHHKDVMLRLLEMSDSEKEE